MHLKGILLALLTLIQEYLTKQRVVIVSGKLYDIPKKSILRSCLFNIFIFDLFVILDQNYFVEPSVEPIAEEFIETLESLSKPFL